MENDRTKIAKLKKENKKLLELIDDLVEKNQRLFKEKEDYKVLANLKVERFNIWKRDDNNRPNKKAS